LTDSLALFGTQLGILLLILFLPGGLASMVEPIRDRLLGWLARRKGIKVTTEEAEPSTEGFGADAVAKRAVAPTVRPILRTNRVVAGEVLLEARGLRKSFGGVRAVDGVSIEVLSGETVGVIGPNGAGKTTMFELVAGFTKVDDGTVWFDGRDIAWMSPE
jgi:ABC-type glutathione transport system ATPase component